MLIIPNNRLNGYNIIAQAPIFDNGSILAKPPTFVLLGHDLSRRYPKYVTALATQSSVDNYREWFWGHYFEGTSTALVDAIADFIARIQLPVRTDA